MPVASTSELSKPSLLRRRLSCIGAVRVGALSAMLFLALPGVHADTPVTSDAAAGSSANATRLERIRESLVDRALEAPVRVTSSAWVDEAGQFRHVTRLFSDLRARALADLEPSNSPRPGSSVSPTEPTLSRPSSPEERGPSGPVVLAPSPVLPARSVGQAPAESAPPSPASDCVRRTDGLRRQAQIRIDARPFDGAHGKAALVRMAEFARAELVRQARGAGLLQPMTIEGLPGNSYDYRLASNGAFDTPYFLDVEVRSTGLADRSLRPGGPLEARTISLTLSLVERAADVVVVRQTFVLSVSGVTPTVGRADWSSPAEPIIRQKVEEWLGLAENALGCEPLRVRSDFQANSVLQIPVGAGAGVRVGDRWLLSDLARVPSRVLERGAMDGMRIAQVVAVGRHSATLRLESSEGRTAGSVVPDRGVQWVAVPL